MRPATTFEQAAKRLQRKFPDSNLTLKVFTKVGEPCVIKCPKHGEQRVSSFSNLLRSTHGCPKCGIEARAEHLSSSYDLAQTISSVAGIVPVVGSSVSTTMSYVCQPSSGHSDVLQRAEELRQRLSFVQQEMQRELDEIQAKIQELSDQIADEAERAKRLGGVEEGGSKGEDGVEKWAYDEGNALMRPW